MAAGHKSFHNQSSFSQPFPVHGREEACQQVEEDYEKEPRVGGQHGELGIAACLTQFAVNAPPGDSLKNAMR